VGFWGVVVGGFVEYLCWLVCGWLGYREAASGVSLREFFLEFGCWLVFVASPRAVGVGGVLVLGEWVGCRCEPHDPQGGIMGLSQNVVGDGF